jgi:sulfane dehydrogenase subunit SoxC
MTPFSDKTEILRPDRPGHARGRRWFMQTGAAVATAVAAACRKAPPPPAPSLLGRPPNGYGERSRFVRSVRAPRQAVSPETSSSQTPLQDSYGIITPSSLHFERHHAGVPDIDPAAHRLMVHGLVERPLVFTVDEVRRFPSVSRVYFIECSGNTSSEWKGAAALDAQRSHGLTSCSEWTGVLASVLLEEAGIRPGAAWVIAEGADAGHLTRSVPLDKMLDDVLVAYAQNGEPIRPEQGYPMRLLVPGWEGNISVKWLRRLQVVDQPGMTREETSKYTDLLADGRSRQFTFVMEAKSVITRPSGGQRLPGPGYHEITGLAWSGRGAIRRVEISTDGGATWADAELQEPVLPRAHTRFRLGWHWDGRDALLQSRCTDETGYVQPSRADLVAARGFNSNYHNNAVHGWRVAADGSVSNVRA